MADLHNDILHVQINSRTLNIWSKTIAGAEHILSSVYIYTTAYLYHMYISIPLHICTICIYLYHCISVPYVYLYHCISVPYVYLYHCISVPYVYLYHCISVPYVYLYHCIYVPYAVYLYHCCTMSQYYRCWISTTSCLKWESVALLFFFCTFNTLYGLKGAICRSMMIWML